MNVPVESTAASIGAAAYSTCQQFHAARVIGVTSRGLFLLASPRQVIFISFEHYRSPLTINLDRSLDQLRTVEVDATAHLFDTRLIFPSIGVAISLSVDALWQCPLPGSKPRSRTEQWQTLLAIGEGVLEHVGNNGLAAILPRLLDLPDALALSAEQSTLLERLITVQRAIQTSDNQAMLAGLTSLLGQGRGLTPSGDDVVIGLLLMLARSLRLKSQAGSENMLKHVIAATYQRTTTISANLIECAANGQGDERLITVVDGIANGSATIDECVDCVLDWGSSSGIDALIGMAVAL